MTWTSVIGFFRSEAPVLVGGLITGPVFGWFGHRWLVARVWTGALVPAAACCFEPLAEGAMRPHVITSALVQLVEIVVGLVMVMRRACRRTRSSAHPFLTAPGVRTGEIRRGRMIMP